jgi:hypothetical protein
MMLQFDLSTLRRAAQDMMPSRERRSLLSVLERLGETGSASPYAIVFYQQDLVAPQDVLRGLVRATLTHPLWSSLLRFLLRNDLPLPVAQTYGATHSEFHTRLTVLRPLWEAGTVGKEGDLLRVNRLPVTSVERFVVQSHLAQSAADLRRVQNLLRAQSQIDATSRSVSATVDASEVLHSVLSREVAEGAPSTYAPEADAYFLSKWIASRPSAWAVFLSASVEQAVAYQTQTLMQTVRKALEESDALRRVLSLAERPL